MLPTDEEPALRLHPLTYLVQGNDVVVGRTDTDSYEVFPADGAALLRQLAAGVPAPAAACWYERRYGRHVDIEEFVGTLRELDFIAAEGAPPAATHRIRWHWLGRAVYSRPAWLAYGALVVTAVLACIADPRLWPARGNVLFTDYLVVVELALAVAQLPLVLLHEASHVLAGRRLGLNSPRRSVRCGTCPTQSRKLWYNSG